MTEITTPHIRQRINFSQTAKGLHQIDCTLETVEEFEGHSAPEALAEKLLLLLKAAERRLKEDGRKLVTEVEA